MSRRPHTWLPLPFEYLVLAALVVVVATWRGPQAQFEEHQAAVHLGLLQFVTMALTLCVGTRALLDRDEHFAIWQLFVCIGASHLAVLPILGAQGLAVVTDNVRWLALGWITVPLTAMAFALPDYGGRAVRTRRQRARMLAPLVLASAIAAAVTLLWPTPVSSPGPNPFAPAERY